MKPEISKIMALSMQDIHDLLSALDLAKITLSKMSRAYRDDDVSNRWASLETRLIEQMRSNRAKRA